MIGDFRIRRRGNGWGVQQQGRWFWRWIGPFGNPTLGIWANSADALWFANFCERHDERQARRSPTTIAPPAFRWMKEKRA